MSCMNTLKTPLNQAMKTRNLVQSRSLKSGCIWQMMFVRPTFSWYLWLVYHGGQFRTLVICSFSEKDLFSEKQCLPHFFRINFRKHCGACLKSQVRWQKVPVLSESYFFDFYHQLLGGGEMGNWKWLLFYWFRNKATNFFTTRYT